MVLALVRGDHRLNEIKLAQRARRRLPPGDAPRRSRPSSGRPASSARSAPSVPVIKDAAIQGGGYFAGANRPDAHLIGVEPGRDFEFEELDFRTRRGRRPVARRRPDRDRDRDRGRQHLQARHPLLRAARRDLPRRRRQGAADRDGQLRDRPGADRRRGDRAERRRARGSSGRARSRPWQVHLVALGKAGEETFEAAERLYEELARGRARDRLRRPRGRAGREAHRRRAARLPAADRGRQARPRRGRGRGAGARARAPTTGSRSPTPPARAGEILDALELRPERDGALEAPPVRDRPLRAAAERRPAAARRCIRGRSRTWSATCGWRRSRSSSCSPSTPATGARRAPALLYLGDHARRLPRRLPRPRHRPVLAHGGAARPGRRPAHGARGRRRLLALRAAAALGAGGRSPRARSSTLVLAQLGAAPRDRHRDQLDRADRRLPGLRRDLLEHGRRLVDHPRPASSSASRWRVAGDRASTCAPALGARRSARRVQPSSST